MQEISSPPLTTSSIESEPLLDRQVFAAERARLLLGCYRRGDANDPETYTTAIAAILSDYPMETIRWVTDPRTGMPGNPRRNPKTGEVWTGLPDPGDVKLACEEHYGPQRRLAQMREQAAKQLSERRPSLPPPKTGVTYAEFMAATNGLGRPIGRFESVEATKGVAPIDPEKFKAAHKISDAEWADLPNQGDQLLPNGKWVKPTLKV